MQDSLAAAVVKQWAALWSPTPRPDRAPSKMMAAKEKTALTERAPISENAHRGYQLLPASLPRTRTLLTTRRRWRNRVSVRRRASGRVHYNYFRDLDPATGRYVESDPIGLSAGVNTYAYAPDPILGADPLGLHVEMTFNRANGVLVAVDYDTGEKVSVNAFSGLGDCRNSQRCDSKEDTGPVPRGRWLIGQAYQHTSGNRGDNTWYKLYGSNGVGGYTYTQMPIKDPKTGKVAMRGGFNLHTGNVSLGCLSVPSDVDGSSPNYPTSEGFDRLKSLLNRTTPYFYNGSTYRGVLHVY
jgi:RHS repeat-associated protein